MAVYCDILVPTSGNVPPIYTVPHPDARTLANDTRPLSGGETTLMARVRVNGLHFAALLDEIAGPGGSGMSRELAISKTKIEEAVMWANRHITK